MAWTLRGKGFALEVEIHSGLREAFFSWAWSELVQFGLSGIDEGTVLAETAFQHGLETSAWVIDPGGERTEHRDWVREIGNSSQNSMNKVKLYFLDSENASAARSRLCSHWKDEKEILVHPVVEIPAQDWMESWKSAFQALDVAPFWKIIPAWDQKTELKHPQIGIRINPGAGFGTGTHETTQLCLASLGVLSQKFHFKKMLDFGSGSGILSIAGAKLGAKVVAVEIDDLAIENAFDNAKLNGLENKIEVRKTIPKDQDFDLVVANIMKNVLLEEQARLLSTLKSGGQVLLSGLLEADVPDVIQAYGRVLEGLKPRVFEKNEWRAIHWLP